MTQRSVWLTIIIALLSACGGTAEVPTLEPTTAHTPTSNVVLVTPDATRLNRDFPPTWTPTFTATITNTPTITPTFTITPSITPIDTDAMCDNFTYGLSGIDGLTFEAGDTIEVTYGISSEFYYAFVGVVLEHDDLEDIIADVLPGGVDYISTFNVSDFPLTGEWRYRTGVFLADGSEMYCRQAGTFTIAEGAVRTAQPNVVPTAQAVPSITPQPTATEARCYLFCPD